MAQYEFEVWNSINVHTMDITHLVRNVRFSMERNNAERLDFDMDMTAFENLCASINEDPRTSFRPYTTDIKVKRDGKYLFGAQIAELTPKADESGASVGVSCDGFLNLFADVYITKNYSQIDGSDIAWDLIVQANAKSIINNDGTLFVNNTGVTRGAVYKTGMLRDRTYEYQNVKDGIINLTNLDSNVFDFSFTHDRIFNTYRKIGSDRPDITISYPASDVGISALKMEMPRTARGALYNVIIGIGSGFGEEALTDSGGSYASAVTFNFREKIVNYNDISDLSTLEQHVVAELNRDFDVLKLPKFTVSGDEFDLNDIGIGDRIHARQTKYKLMNVDATYRIEKLDVALDENFSELIDVTLDNYQI